MAKEKTIQEMTTEELIALVGEKEATIEALTAQLQVTAETVSKVEALESENADLKLQLQKEVVTSRAVPGTYKSKKHKKEIRFKDGARKTRVGTEVIDSAELIENVDGKYSDVLDRLIELGASTIEVIK